MILVGTQNIRMARGMQTVQDMLMRFKMGSKTKGIGLEATNATFWKRTNLHFVYVLRLYGKLSLKVMDKLTW
jgi:hypothetical protein